MIASALPEARADKALLAAAVIFALAYLAAGAGLDILYPAGAAIKTLGPVLLAVYAARRGAFALMAALLASAAGDAALALQPAQMTSGIAAFALAHLVYIGIFAVRIRQDGLRPHGWAGAVALTAFGALMLLWLRPDMGELRDPATAYTVIITVMAVAAVLARAHLLAAAGALSFLASDAILAAMLFKDAPGFAGLAVWVFYFGGQLLLALGLSAPRTPARS